MTIHKKGDLCLLRMDKDFYLTELEVTEVLINNGVIKTDVLGWMTIAQFNRMLRCKIGRVEYKRFPFYRRVVILENDPPL